MKNIILQHKWWKWKLKITRKRTPNRSFLSKGKLISDFSSNNQKVTLTSMKESVKITFFELSAFGWLPHSNLSLTCKGLRKTRSCRLLFDLNRNWLSESLLGIPFGSRISANLAAVSCWPSAVEIGLFFSFKYRGA